MSSGIAEERPTGEQEKKSTEVAKEDLSNSTSSSEQYDDDQTVYPKGKALALIMLAIYLAVFLVALVWFSVLKDHNRGK